MTDSYACGAVRFDDQVHGLPCVLDRHPLDRPHLDARGGEWSTVDCAVGYRERTVLPFISHPRPGFEPVRVMCAPDGNVLVAGIPHSPKDALELAGAIGRAVNEHNQEAPRG